MIVFELINNAARHAFPGREGEIRVELLRVGAFAKCSVTDNGSAAPTVRPGRGLKIIDELSKSLGGRCIQKFETAGIVVDLGFPLPQRAYRYCGGAAKSGSNFRTRSANFGQQPKHGALLTPAGATIEPLRSDKAEGPEARRDVSPERAERPPQEHPEQPGESSPRGRPSRAERLRSHRGVRTGVIPCHQASSNVRRALIRPIALLVLCLP